MEQIILNVEAMRHTDREDASGWTYGVFYCPHLDDDLSDVDLDDAIACVGGYIDYTDLIAHMQYCHDVDLDETSPVDVDLDASAPVDVDLDSEYWRPI